jgi:uncharacterized membrane protein
MDIPNTKTISRLLLGTGLVFAGTSHLTFARKEFRAQVPDWVPLAKDDTVVYSGLVEIGLGAALILARGKSRPRAGKLAAIFFAAVFPGNIAQFTHRRNAFGLNSNSKRLVRLAFQPVLIAWALKSTQQ